MRGDCGELPVAGGGGGGAEVGGGRAGLAGDHAGTFLHPLLNQFSIITCFRRLCAVGACCTPWGPGTDRAGEAATRPVLCISATQSAALPGGTAARSPASTCPPALALAGMTTSGPGGTLQFESAMGGAARCCSPSCLSASDPGDLLLAVASVRLAMSCIVVLVDNIDPCTYLHCNSRYPCNPCNSDG